MPVTVMVSPEAALVGSTVALAAGTLWVVEPVTSVQLSAAPVLVVEHEIVAVTALVDGMPVVGGTVKLPLICPALSAGAGGGGGVGLPQGVVTGGIARGPSPGEVGGGPPPASA